MIRSCTSPSNKVVLAAILCGGWLAAGSTAWAAANSFERDPMTMRVVTINPSVEKTQLVPVRIDLPLEIGPEEVLDAGGLLLEYDTERSQHYVYLKDGVTLAPKQTKVFSVLIRDVWFIPAPELDGLRNHTEIVLSRLVKSAYYESARQLGDLILTRLDGIAKIQSDETISRRRRIGAYRRNREALKEIKEDIERMEKLLSFAGGVPVPQMLEESPLRSDAPSTTTTWLVIFLIIIFMGFLAGQFFFTWQRKLKGGVDFSGQQSSQEGEQPSGQSGEK